MRNFIAHILMVLGFLLGLFVFLNVLHWSYYGVHLITPPHDPWFWILLCIVSFWLFWGGLGIKWKFL